MRQAVIHAFTKAISTVWIVLTPLCGVCLILGTYQTSQNHAPGRALICARIVFFIRNYSMKRTIVQEGRKTSEGETPSGAITPVTREASPPSEKPRTIEEERKASASDIEKGFSEDGTVDANHDEVGEGYVKKG